MSKPAIYKGIRSPIIAIFGFLIFSVSLLFLITMDINILPLWILPFGTLWMTLLFTGLFITVHDSMHGSITPKRPKVNNAIGTISIFFYALFSYKKLRREHLNHHRNPGTLKDPDYHDGKNSGFFSWYFKFMKEYISIIQIIGMALIFNFLFFVVGLNWSNLILFWIIPSIGSTFQLFYFGTYLPHREPEGGYQNKYHATSSDYPFFISLLTCYHFGYHLEHHKYPYVQWWRLPWVKKGNYN